MGSAHAESWKLAVSDELGHAPDETSAELEKGDDSVRARAIGHAYIGDCLRLVSDEAMRRESPHACGRSTES